MSVDTIEKQINQMQNLAKMPPVISQINEMLEAPNMSMAILGDEIAKDLGVTSKLLKLANSSFYGFPGTISTATQALILMGIEAVQGLILAAEVFGKLPRDLYRMTGHSMIVARVCREIAQMLELKRADDIATAGLLHDVGVVILILNDKNQYRRILKNSQEQKISLIESEKQELGFDHSQVGYRLAEHWYLPDRLITPIRFHHHPEKTTKFQTETAIIAVANTLVNAAGGGIRDDLIVESLNDRYIKLLNLDESQILDLTKIVLSILDDAMSERL